jgi:hypothetical protein
MKQIKTKLKENWELIIITLACGYLMFGLNRIGEYLVLIGVWVLLIFLITTVKNFGNDDKDK